MAKYGIPYMGSKGKIAEEICKIFPKSDHFYDLFGGGFSITHCMVKNRGNQYKQFHFNEIRRGAIELIQDAINGKYNYVNFKPPFIDRETFFKNIDSDFYTKIIWSFGNNGMNYLYSKEIEPFKKSMHNAIVFNEFDDLAKKTLGMDKFKEGYSIKDRRLYLGSKIEFYRINGVPEFLHEFLRSEQQLERLERLQQKTEKIKFYNNDYKSIEIFPNSIIYCDPPYQGTAEYDGNKSFKHKEFLDWADSQRCPVFISEYNISDKRFKLVKKIKKRSLLSADKSVGDKWELVYCNKSALEFLKSKAKK